MKYLIGIAIGGIIAGAIFAHLNNSLPIVINKDCSWKICEKCKKCNEKKGMTNDEIIKATELCKKDGLGVRVGTYMFGGGVSSVNCVPINIYE